MDMSTYAYWAEVERKERQKGYEEVLGRYIKSLSEKKVIRRMKSKRATPKSYNRLLKELKEYPDLYQRLYEDARKRFPDYLFPIWAH